MELIDRDPACFVYKENVLLYVLLTDDLFFDSLLYKL